MCDHAPARVEPDKAHWVAKLVTGFILAALTFEIVRGP